jgi:hypothetical protein
LSQVIGVRGVAFVEDDVWDRYEASLRRKAASLVRHHRQQIEIVGQALQERGTLKSRRDRCADVSQGASASVGALFAVIFGSCILA